MHATTILMVRQGGRTVIGGDGQVSLGQTIVKGNARKVRRLAKGGVIGGFAGATADAFTLFERLEGKLEQYPGQLTRACVELTKDWRTDRYLRRLEAMMLVADKEVSLLLSGAGDVLERADTAAWITNHASLGVSRAMGYQDNGTTTRAADGKRVEQVNLTLRHSDWRRSPEDCTIVGLSSGASEMLGLPWTPGVDR